MPKLRRLVLGMALILFAACTGDSSPPDTSEESPPQSSPARVGEPKGTVKVGFVGAPATLDPYAITASDLTRALVRPLLPSLFTLNPAGEAVSSLAQSLEEVDGGVRISLADATWSNDEPVTAKDVVRSVRRADWPSGFAAATSARVVDRKTLELSGKLDDWPAALATAAYVLPGGRWDPDVTAGPLEIVKYTPNAELHLRVSPGAPLAFRDWRMRFYERSTSLIEELSSGELDAAHLPSAVNLGERLDRQEVSYAAALGWEWIGFRVSDDSIAGELARSAPLDVLLESFIRGDGEAAKVRWPPAVGVGGAEGYPEGAAGLAFTVAVPTGDELLAMLQKAVQIQAKERGATMELADIDARTFYGRWQEAPEVGALLMRSSGAPFLSSQAPEVAGPKIPLFRVKTYLAWGDTLAPLEVNPTIEGPLWDLESWRQAVPTGE